MIEQIPFENREQWLPLRQREVTASTIGALFNLHPFISPLALHLLKAGIISEDPEESPPMRRGRLLESVAVQLVSEQWPGWKLQYPVGLYYRDPDARLGATPDLLAFDPERGPGVVQIKSTQASIFRRWREDDNTISPPLHVVLQAVGEGYLTGAKWAAVAVLVVDFGIDLHLVEIPIHLGVIDRIKAEVAKFWDRVARKDPPPADYARDGRLIAKLFPQSDGSIIDLSGDNMIPVLAVEDDLLAGEIKKRKERRDAIKCELLSKLGAASGATFQGGFLSAKSVNRKAYSVAASSYRDVRIKLETPA